MTAISLGQAARRGRLSRMAITAAIKVGRVTSNSDGYLIGPAQLREHFEMALGKGCPPFTVITPMNARRRGSGSAQHRGNSCGLIAAR